MVVDETLASKDMCSLVIDVASQSSSTECMTFTVLSTIGAQKLKNGLTKMLMISLITINLGW